MKLVDRLDCARGRERCGLVPRWLVACPLACLLLAACSSTSPVKVEGAPEYGPDESYETDGVVAHRVLIWKCNAYNERTSMIMTCAGGTDTCGRWHVDRTLCPTGAAGREATRTSDELTVEAHRHGRHPMPREHTYYWKVATPAVGWTYL